MLRCSEALGVLECPKQGSDTVQCVFKGHSGIRETRLGRGGSKGKKGKEDATRPYPDKGWVGGPLLSQEVSPHHLGSPGFPLSQPSQ